MTQNKVFYRGKNGERVELSLFPKRNKYFYWDEKFGWWVNFKDALRYVKDDKKSKKSILLHEIKTL